MKRLKNIFMMCALFICALCMMSSCNLAKVNPGEEGVFNLTPWIFGSGGVDTIPLTEGSAYYVPSTSFTKFTVTPVQYDEEFKDIFTKNKVPIEFTAHALIQIQRGKTPYLYSNFGVNWYENNIKRVFTNEVRKEICKYSMEELISNRQVYDSISIMIKDVLDKIIVQKNIPITLLSVVIDKATPNKEVLDEYNQTAKQLQANETQDARKKAEEKRAEADDAYRKRMGLTTEQFITLRALEIEKEKIEMVKNKDKVSVSLFMGNGEKVYPTYGVK